MKTSVALYVLSAVTITTANQAPVSHKRFIIDEDDFSSNPWNPTRENAGTQIWGINPEDTDIANEWNIKRIAVERSWDDDHDKGSDTDWRYQDENVSPGHKDSIYKGSRVMHSGTRDGEWGLRKNGNTDSTLWKPVNEELDDLRSQTKSWITNDRNVRHNNELNSDGRRLVSDNWRSLAGNVVRKPDHKDGLWARNGDDRRSNINPQRIRDEAQWLYRRGFTHQNNDYWYTDDAHPGFAFVLTGVSMAGPQVAKLDGEWLKNTDTGEMEDGPWERHDEFRDGSYEQFEDIALKTRKSM
ncbi:uncharacterized protein LOC126323049 [Schistocerca gregaria]|uniref:uncharacterized protein LOC126323049 n=1 Tax=Schistocerca gregaria TaxID=7010 RepID=UPI00211E2041|nr:uncharacterized protein LOC126323049 [Schistocerca gregaria]